ncbi:hypothetical protein STA3757_07770 [Stanieria sp. NIES-3757]|nr:hypothetical protein STA3757_07770 [Stanieria sp. NIES-3757]
MRQLFIQVPSGEGKKVVEIAKDHAGANLLLFEASSNGERVDAVIVHFANRKIEDFLAQLESIPQLKVTLIPRGVMTLKPPPDEAAQQVTEVSDRSPIEVFLAGLQSVGSWRSFLGYAALAGVVVWIGLFTNTNYLLVAAMLIAPFAGPAMNTAIATARGDLNLLKRSLIRYFSALGLTIVVAALLSFIFQQKAASNLMTQNSQISVVAVLLPLAAGAAGALNLFQSERSSLVSGAATGMLVAASLAPPAGIIGMSLAISRWDMVVSGIFLLLLQLVGINLTAATLFRLYGLSSKGARYNRGKAWVFPIGLILTGIVLAGLLGWQLSNPPEFQRSSRAQRATETIQQVLEESSLVQLVEANVRFTRSNIQSQNTLLGVIYVQPQTGVNLSASEIRDRITAQIQSSLLEEGFNATPLIDTIVLEKPVTLTK